MTGILPPPWSHSQATDDSSPAPAADPAPGADGDTSVPAIDPKPGADDGPRRAADGTSGAAIDLAPRLDDGPRLARAGAGERPSVRRLVRSFGFAGAGIVALVRWTPNFWIHLAAALVALAVSLWLRL